MAKELTPVQRAQAMAVLADGFIRAGDVPSAAKMLEGVTRLRRGPDDWMLLARCYLQLQQPRKALLALRQAEAIRPDRPDVHEFSAEAYRLLGDAAKSREHLDQAKWLIDHVTEP